MSNKYLEDVAGRSSQSERTSWKRRLSNMEKLVEQLKPIEEEILKLFEQKAPILEEMASLRREMVDICVHPVDNLVVIDETPETHVVVECKFCGKHITASK